jgi:hypothetical protein
MMLATVSFALTSVFDLTQLGCAVPDLDHLLTPRQSASRNSLKYFTGLQTRPYYSGSGRHASAGFGGYIPFVLFLLFLGGNPRQ